MALAMTVARKRLVHVDTTPFYHCITRCVRRAFLCGEDVVTGKNFDHRKAWVVEKLKQLSDAFCIDICAYAIMSNHLHLVLRINDEQAKALSDEELLERYKKVFPRSVADLGEMPAQLVKERLKVFRERIYDLSWFMRCLSESIARRANKEDRCSGRFWEGRFRSQALLDDAALLTCMAYVDLNPVRAGVTSSLERSDFTSIQQRLFRAARRKKSEQTARPPNQQRRSERAVSCITMASSVVPELMSFCRRRDGSDAEECERLPIRFDDYIELLRWTGEAVRDDKRGALSARSASLLARAGVVSEHWVDTVTTFHEGFSNMVGQTHHIDAQCKRLGLEKTKGVGFARKAFAKAS